MTSTIPNILVFGETGVGKSSLINMLRGVPDTVRESMDSESPETTSSESDSSTRTPDSPPQSPTSALSTKVSNRVSIAISSPRQDPPPRPPIPNRKDSAYVSSSASGCTFHYESYKLCIDDKEYKVWDTVGLNEGDLGRAPAAKAMSQLEHLVNNIAHKDGISLLVYCVRANRITQTATKNYRIFYSALCRKKVPIVLVVLGLEHYDGEMQDWWGNNAKDFKKHRMYFSDCVCATATRGYPTEGLYPYQERYDQSGGQIQKLISQHCALQPWKVSATAQAIQDIVTLIQKVEEDNPNIHVHDLCQPTGSGFSITTSVMGEPLASTLAGTVLIGTKRYTLHNAQIDAQTKDLPKDLGKDPSLLILCVDDDKVEDEVERFKEVCVSHYDGTLNNTPLIVMVNSKLAAGSLPDSSVEVRKTAIDQLFRKNDFVVPWIGFHLRGSGDEDHSSSRGLADAIAQFTLELSAKETGLFKTLWKSVRNVMRRNR